MVDFHFRTQPLNFCFCLVSDKEIQKEKITILFIIKYWFVTQGLKLSTLIHITRITPELVKRIFFLSVVSEQMLDKVFTLKKNKDLKESKMTKVQLEKGTITQSNNKTGNPMLVKIRYDRKVMYTKCCDEVLITGSRLGRRRKKLSHTSGTYLHVCLSVLLQPSGRS